MNTDEDRGEWLTAEQLAERYQVTLRTVYEWNTTGTGPQRHRFGSALRYRLADVEAWEAEQRVPA